MTNQPETQSEQPRIRWAAIIWGIVLSALAGVGIWLASSSARFDVTVRSLVDWAIDADPMSVTVLVVLVIGAAVLISGLAAGARRLQKSVTEHRTASDAGRVEAAAAVVPASPDGRPAPDPATGEEPSAETSDRRA